MRNGGAKFVDSSSTSPPLADATILRLAGSNGFNPFKLGLLVRGPRRYDEIVHDSCTSRSRNKSRASKINASSVGMYKLAGYVFGSNFSCVTSQTVEFECVDW